MALPPSSPLGPQLQEVGVRSVRLPFRRSNSSLPDLRRPGSVLRSAASVARVVREIVRLARRERIDLIHANSVVAGVHALPAAMLLRLPCVVHARDFNTAQLTILGLKEMLRYRRSAAVYVSEALARFHGERLNGNPRRRIIHNGVDTQVVPPGPGGRERLRAGAGAPRRLLPGRRGGQAGAMERV